MTRWEGKGPTGRIGIQTTRMGSDCDWIGGRRVREEGSFVAL